MAAIGGESFYAVIIICLIVFFSLFACFGIRVIKKLRQKNQQEALHNNNANHDWQPLRSIAIPLENTDSQTLEAVAKWQAKYPANVNQYIDVTKNSEVIVKGVLAWRFVETPTTVDAEEESNAAIMDESSSIVFCQGQGSIMTNLPVPIQEFSYWEVKVLKLNDQDRLAIGLATHPYPRWRLPGWHRHSIAYHSNTGSVFASDPTCGKPYGNGIKEGDVIGVGYLCQSGTVFFTQNGQNLGKASIGFKYPLYPIVGSIGPCHISVNFGYEDFLFSPANQREAAFALRQGSIAPPPAYGGHTDDMLFNGENVVSSQNANDQDGHLTYVDRTVQPPPPSYS